MASEKGLSFWEKLTGKVVWHVSSTVNSEDLVPTIIPDKGAVLVGPEEPKLLVFNCPCGAGHRVKVVLDVKATPHWKVLQKKKLSVYPSIRSEKCHFLITNGNIMWKIVD